MTSEPDIPEWPEKILRSMRKAQSAHVDIDAALSDSLEELKVIYDTAPVGLCLLDAEMRYVRINRRFAELNGVPLEQHIGRRVIDIVPDLSAQVTRMVDEVLQTGEPRYDVEISGETPAQPGVLRHWLVNWVPLFAADGTVRAVNIVVQEITEQKRREALVGRLLRELDGRVSNTLAMAHSIVRQTLRDEDMDGAREIGAMLENRLVALASAHSLMIKGAWLQASVHDVVDWAISEFDTSARLGPQIELSGGEVHLGPKSALALALTIYELATNAEAFGALSTPRGTVQIEWEARHGQLLLDWQERNGPPVSPPTRKGFGTRLLERILRFEIDATANVRFSAGGVKCSIIFPLENELDPALQPPGEGEPVVADR